MTLRSDLIAARALIDTPEKWAEDDTQRYGTSKLCALDAICNVHSNSVERMRQALVAALPADFRRHGTVAAFNDAPTTTHPDVMSWFQRAIDNAGERE